MTSTVAFEPEPIDARARDDDGVALMSCPGLDMVHQLGTGLVYALRDGGH